MHLSYTVQHGFPNKPTCIAWDPLLRLMAIGTASGAIKVLGRPGVEFYGQHSGSTHYVSKLVFVPNEGRLVSLCDDNSLHLWEVNDVSMEEVKTYVLEGKLKKISTMCLESSGQNLLLGTEGGNIYVLNVSTFEMASTVIYQDVVMQKVPEDYKINPGAVESIQEQPGHPDNILIGYNRGLIVLWNRKTPAAEQTYVSTQQLESLCWEESGSKFMSSHNDGSYASWDVSVGSKPTEEPSTPYGPFPCKAITKLLSRQDPHEPHDDLLIFAGGMPRASFSDRHTITALKSKHVNTEGKHIVFDFTSKVIDFFTIRAPDDGKGVIALIVLAEEELVAIDLLSEDWKMLGLPYLVSLHASAVTCSTYVSDVPEELWNNIVTVGKAQSKGLYSDSKWPIDGGLCQGNKEKVHRDLLLTGHEDGSVRFWDAGGISLTPLYKFTSSQALQGEDDLGDGSVAATEEEDDWPPFRKVGTFDPYSDDPRLAVKKVSLCPSGVLAVAGTAGYVIVAKLNLEEASKQVKVVTMNIVGDRDAFVWKGHEKLSVRGGGTDPLQLNPGFQPISLLQLHPPAAITALAMHSQWSLVAAGTAHGLAVFDYLRSAAVITKCTLNPNDLSGVGDAPISRRKSFKKSLRESFRRLRKGRSQRHPEKRGVQTPTTPEPKKTPPGDSPSPSRVGSTPNTPIEAKPVERAIEARPVDDSLGSMVRCISFSRTFIISVQNMTPTLWAGTNNGTVYVFTIAVPGGAKRTEEPVSCQLGKEIQLKHRAPVIGINIIDAHSYPVEPDVKPTEVNAPHRVIISSEEQIKIFTLPALKPFCKLKLTAAEGARVRRTAVAQFHAGQHDEVCLLCLTNLGDTIVLSLPDLRRQINAAVIRREDINGISSLSFTCHGEGLYLHSSSELQRITVSASRVTTPICKLELPQSARVTSATTNGNDSSSSSSSDSSSDSESSSSSDEEEDKKEDRVTDSRLNNRLEKVIEVKENGIGDEDGTHDLSSVGDITIDSVKDHLINSSSAEENRVITEIVRNESTKLETTTSESVTVKTTLITTNETTLITPPPETENPALIMDSTLVEEIRKAPLAKMEDLEVETAA